MRICTTVTRRYWRVAQRRHPIILAGRRGGTATDVGEGGTDLEVAMRASMVGDMAKLAELLHNGCVSVKYPTILRCEYH
jgi:hypothetical protein